MLPGEPFPLGASAERGGVRFAVASSVAESVEVCLIDTDGTERRVELSARTFGVWHGLVPGITPGQRYGFRAHGPYEPARGLRCNPAKLLLDPYARQIAGSIGEYRATLGYDGDPMTGAPSSVDSLGHVPVSVVTSSGGPDTGVKPRVPFEESLIYELHVRGFTRLHPDVPPHQRGTYLGLAHPAVIDYLTRLRVTAVELLPVHTKADEPSLAHAGRQNYWGYSPLGHFAPYAGYSTEPGREVEEFRTMVAALHAAGIEVIVDVVFNHTCEGGVSGPTLSWRGLDAPAYYLHGPQGAHSDITGTGNTLDAASPTVVRMVTDALRYWTGELGVDGFRFDLASVLGRPGGGPFDPNAPLLTAIATDPLLSSAKLIAEPWDASSDGYRVGGFGPQFAEWNGRYRDSVRDFWRGRSGIRDLAYRLSGSSDLYSASGRKPWASVNFVTAHDGFTLRDLVSYNHKHNQANGENNRDGTDDNRSWNCGAEGETDDASVLALRARQARNLLSTLLLSTGTPMLPAGDERWRTQHGNNNAYCLDDATTWLNWSPGRDCEALLEFTSRTLGLRAQCPGLRRPVFFEGRSGRGRPDLVWLRADGQELTESDWFDEDCRTLQMWTDGSRRPPPRDESKPTTDDAWLLTLHAGQQDIKVTLPPAEYGASYLPVLDTGTPDGVPGQPAVLAPGSRIAVPGRTVMLFRVLRERGAATAGGIGTQAAVAQRQNLHIRLATAHGQQARELERLPDREVDQTQQHDRP